MCSYYTALKKAKQLEKYFRAGGIPIPKSDTWPKYLLVSFGNTSWEKDAIVSVNHDRALAGKDSNEHRRWRLTSNNTDQKTYPPVPCGDGTYLLARVVHLHRELA